MKVYNFKTPYQVIYGDAADSSGQFDGLFEHVQTSVDCTRHTFARCKFGTEGRGEREGRMRDEGRERAFKLFKHEQQRLYQAQTFDSIVWVWSKI